MTHVLSAIPSPGQGVWYVGPFPIRAYALAIIIGIVVAAWLGMRRYEARGGEKGVILDVTFWAVPFGIVGGRLYHVVSSPEAYFGANGDPVKALYIWQGGLGIWGAIALGAVGAYIGAKRRGVLFPPIADALAPGILIAQAIGRLGNYFNQELFGKPTTLPWGLEVDASHSLAAGYPAGTLFHPTFLYEMVWNLLGAGLLLWLDRKLRMGHGRVFWLYVVIYTAGRTWIEMLRIDPAEQVLGMRLNVWTSLLMFVASLVVFVWLTVNRPGRESVLTRPEARAAGEVAGAEAADGGHEDTADAESSAEGEADDGANRVAEGAAEDGASAPQKPGAHGDDGGKPPAEPAG